jgi:hypothetical protein
MREYFQKQLNENSKVTQEALDLVKQKTYTSGREIKVNETILFAFLEENETLKMITLHEDELDNYSCINMTHDYLPKITKK